MKTPITTLRLPEDLKQRAAKKAREESTNLTQLIIRLLNNYLS